MDSESRTSARTRQGHEPQEELSALRDIYAVALAKAAVKKKAGGTNAGEDYETERTSHVSRERSIPDG